MPSNLLSIDSNFPSFTGEESPQQQIQALHNYLFQLREGLQYSLRNLTAENFNSAALKELTDEQSSAVIEELKKLQNIISAVSGDLERLRNRVAAVEGYGSRISTAEGNIGDIQDAVEDLGAWQLDTDGRVETLENDVAGEEGLKAQLSEVKKSVGALGQVVRILEDGAVSLGEEGGVLRLIGRVYVNGVLLEIKAETGEPEEEVPDDSGGENTGGTDSEIT